MGSSEQNKRTAETERLKLVPRLHSKMISSEQNEQLAETESAPTISGHASLLPESPAQTSLNNTPQVILEGGTEDSDSDKAGDTRKASKDIRVRPSLKREKSRKQHRQLQQSKSELRRRSTVSATTPQLQSPQWRLTPWADWRDWLQMKRLLSRNDHTAAHRLLMFFSMRRRALVPIAMSTSVALLTHLNADISTGADGYAQRLGLAMTLTRFVNGMTDVLQPYDIDRRAISVSIIASRLQMPPILVEIRHQASHGILPPLLTLQDAARQGQFWLNTHYWQPQYDQLCEMGLLCDEVASLAPVFAHESYSEERSYRLAKNPLPQSTKIPKLVLPERTEGCDSGQAVLRRLNSVISNWDSRQKQNTIKQLRAHRISNSEVQGIWFECTNSNDWVKTPIGLIPGQKQVPPIPTISQSNFVPDSDPDDSASDSDSHFSWNSLSGEDDEDGVDEVGIIIVRKSLEEEERPLKRIRTFSNDQEKRIAKETTKLRQLFASAIDL